MIAALVPVKRLGAGKSRLLGSLDRDAIERLTLAMLGDILAALQGVSRIDHVAVVTPDEVVARASEAAGAEALLRKDPGLNPSLTRAGAELAARGFTRLLVVLGDVAGASATDLEALFDALDGLGRRGVVLAPSRDGGTSALLRAPHDVIPNHFGKDSAAAHRDLARGAGIPYSELPLPSLAIDLDRIEDVEALLEAARGADRTRALLRELGFGRQT
jgi:2-phospho-L-lactate guanylyltransferase